MGKGTNMEFEKSLKIALNVASENKPSEKPVTLANADTLVAPIATAEARVETPLITPSAVREAMNIVSAVAEGKDPFTTDALSRHKPEDNPETVKSLCVALTYLAERLGLKQHTASATAATNDRGSMPLDDYIHQIERRETLLALDAARYNKTEAARILGITFRALRYKLEQFGIE